MRTNAISFDPVPQLSIKSVPSFSKYREGDLLRSEVVDVSGNTVRLKMADGKILTADFRSNIPIFAGDSIELLVSSKLPQQLMLQITSLNGQSIQPEVSMLENLLLQSGIECSPRNMEAARVLQQLSLPLLPASLRTISNALSRFVDLPPAQAAFMTANSIPINEQNIAVVRTWLNTTPTVDQLAQPILDYLAFVSAEEASSTAQPKYLSAADDMQSQPSVSSFSSPTVETLKAQSQNSMIIPVADAQKDSSPAAAVTESLPNKGAASIKGTASMPLHQFLSLLDESGTAAVSSSMDELTQLLALPMKERSSAAFAFVKNLPDAPVAVKTAVLSALLGAPNAAEGKPEAAGQTSLAQALPGQALPGQTSPGHASLVLTSPEQMIPAQADKADIPPPNQGEVSSLESSSDTVFKLVTELFAKLSPKSDENAIQLQQAAETVNEKLHTIHTLLPAQNSEAYSTLSANLEQQLAQNKLGSELNNFYYAQLPFVINEREQAAQLYVLKRDPSKKKINEDNVTILMALSTENLGQVDSILKVSKNNLHVQMCAEKSEVRAFLKEQLPLLHDLLASTRYKLQSFTVKGIDTPLTPLSVNQIVRKELGITVSGLDISV